MSQVLAIGSDTEKITAPEQNQSRTSGIDFEQFLAKEKQKILLPFSLSLFPQIFGTNIQPDHKLDQSVSKILDRPAADNNDRYFPKNPTTEKPSEVSKKTEKAAASEENANTVKVSQLQLTNNAANKIFIGELELTPEFYSMLVAAKNRTSLLQSIDIDDLVSQIKNKIKILQQNGTMELSMELKPDNLGTIIMDISNNKGVISINIYADKLAKDALEDNLRDLENSLKKANLVIGDIKVFPEDKKKRSSR